MIGQSRNGSYFVACSLATLAIAIFLTVSIRLMFGLELFQQLFFEMELIQQQLSQLLLSKQSVKALVAIRFLPLLLERSLVQLFQAEAETRHMLDK